MLKYLIEDLWRTGRYLPYLGILLPAMLLIAMAGNIGRKAQNKEYRPILATALFWSYIAVILLITFFSRESGTRSGFDLEIGSTWGINSRNNAFVIENILLFIPFGVLAPCSNTAMRNFFVSLIWGVIFSWGIECLQLVTGRGFFQIDDIITNVLGNVLGFLIYTIAAARIKKRRS